MTIALFTCHLERMSESLPVTRLHDPTRCQTIVSKGLYVATGRNSGETSVACSAGSVRTKSGLKFYVHTHRWVEPGDAEPKSIVVVFRKNLHSLHYGAQSPWRHTKLRRRPLRSVDQSICLAQSTKDMFSPNPF